MAAIIRIYTRLLEKHPWKTQMLSTGILSGCGDIIAQTAVEKRSMDTYDKMRTTRFLIYGIFITGPALRGWYMVLDKAVKGAGKLPTIKRVLMDQSMFAPTFCSTFIFNMALWRTKSLDSAKQQVKQDFVPVLTTNYKVWPMVQLVNFYMVPLQHRVLVVNIVALFWNTYLAWRTESFEAHPPIVESCLESEL